MPQTLQELTTRVNQISAIFGSILNDQIAWANLGAGKQQQLITGINKAYGQAMSFLHEYLTTHAAQTKLRSVVTQIHADVTVGTATDLFAKSVECKSVTKPEKGAVNKIIGDAIEQLAGTTGHLPRADDVRVVDVRIDGDNNPWPLAGGQYGILRAPALLATIRQAAESELDSLVINSPKLGAQAICTWLAGENYVHGVQQFGRLSQIQNAGQFAHPNSTRPVYLDSTASVRKVRCLSIKIRYEAPFLLSDPMPPNQCRGLLEIVMQIYRHHIRGLVTETVKVKILTADFSNPQNVQSAISRI